MNWVKKGLIYKPKGDLWWSRQRAYLPTAIIIDNKIRIYFASMDENMIGRVGFIDVASKNPSNILYIHKDPVLGIGETGCFDESGVTPSQAYKTHSDLLVMNYFGWMKTTKAPQLLFSSYAISDDNGITFKRVSSAPSLLDRTTTEYISRSTPFFISKRVRKLYYTGTIGGFAVNFNNTTSPKYTVKKVFTHPIITESKDCLELKDDEFGLSRPWVIFENNIYKMFYSRRSISKSYRLGYAESKDGTDWVRKDDELNLDISSGEFDSEMMCFTSLVDVGNKRYMFYNGNQHGASGIGYAELQL